MENKSPEERPAAEKPSPKPKPKPKKAEVGPRFVVSSSPHVHDGRTISQIMRLVIIALTPAALYSIYIFGLDALRVYVISMASAIVIAKQLYGGLGFNPFNPALVGRVVLLISFPVHMTARWVTPSRFGADAVTTATPLTKMKESLATLGYIDVSFGREEILDLLIGNRAGCLGETSVVLLLIGGLFLFWKRVISWRIPVTYIGAVWVMTGIFYLIDPTQYANPSFHVITGGLFLGALYMATDYVSSPVTKTGMLIFGAGCGVITVLIRLWGAYPEGVSFAILLMNATTPLIDRYTRPKVFGAVDEKKAAA